MLTREVMAPGHQTERTGKSMARWWTTALNVEGTRPFEGSCGGRCEICDIMI